MIFLNIILIGNSTYVLPWKYVANTHLAILRGISSVDSIPLGRFVYRDVAQSGSAHGWGP